MIDISFNLQDAEIILSATVQDIILSATVQDININVEGGTKGDNGADGSFVSPPLQPVVSGGTAVAIPAGKLLLCIAFNAAAGDRTFSIGTTSGGTEITELEEITTNKTYVLTLSRYFQTSASIFFSGINADVRMYII